MSKLKGWFYSTTLYYKFRYYFIRQKAPLSWIFWGEIMRREHSSYGSYDVSIAARGEPDCALSFHRGAPKDNNIAIDVYDSNNKIVETVYIPLSYKNMGRVMAGFDKAFAVSAKKIREEEKTQHV